MTLSPSPTPPQVNFFFSSSSVVEFTRQAALTGVGFTSQVGGLVGLFMGFSFLSAVELLYWFTYRMGRNVLGGSRRKVGRRRVGRKKKKR